MAESNGYVWSVTFDTPTVVGGATNAGDQPPVYVNGRMLGNISSGSYFRVEVRGDDILLPPCRKKGRYDYRCTGTVQAFILFYFIRSQLAFVVEPNLSWKMAKFTGCARHARSNIRAKSGHSMPTLVFFQRKT